MQETIEFKTKTTSDFDEAKSLTKDQFVGKEERAGHVIERVQEGNETRASRFASKLARGSVLIQQRRFALRKS